MAHSLRFDRLPTQALDIGVGADGSVWMIGTQPAGPGDYGVVRWDGRNGLAMGGGGIRIAVGPNGDPWILTAAGQIFCPQPNGWGPPLPGLGIDIAVGANGSAWLIGTNPVGTANDGGVYRWEGRQWVDVGGGGVRIAVAPDGTPWLVNSVGQIYVGSRGGWGRPLPGLARDIGIGADGSVWIIGTNPVGRAGDGGIFRWNGRNWAEMPGGGVAISVGPDGTPWVVNSVGEVYHGY